MVLQIIPQICNFLKPVMIIHNNEKLGKSSLNGQLIKVLNRYILESVKYT